MLFVVMIKLLKKLSNLLLACPLYSYNLLSIQNFLNLCDFGLPLTLGIEVSYYHRQRKFKKVN